MTAATANLTHRERELGAIINAYNEVTERLKTSHDQLTREVRRLHEQLDETNCELARRERLAALGEMAAGVAHEIRNPLAGIQLYAALLIRDLEPGGATQALAGKIADGVRTLEAIVRDFLAFGGPAAPRPTRVTFDELVHPCLELAEPARAAGRVRVVVDAVDAAPAVWIDARQMKRAILNLILNAIDAAGEGGEVTVSAAGDTGAGVGTLQVADSGAGIPADLLDRIFDPFFTTKESGTGLGLAIVHRIAEANGGRIRARNGSEGGAVFELAVPLAVAAVCDPENGCGQRIVGARR